MTIFLGCAGWNLRKEFAEEFSSTGTHLERYAERLNCVEINSSFYRPHRIKTYQRWAASTPSGFRFAVKLPKEITHVRRLINVEPQIERFVGETSGLGEKLGPILIQLPPSLAFNISPVERFFRELRAQVATPIVCEPRHPSWFDQKAEMLMEEYLIDRVAADSKIVLEAAMPGGCKRNYYFRWHGSPRMYYSEYDEHALGELATQIISVDKANSVWCIFDNTAEGAALKNALAINKMIKCAVSVDKTVA